MRSEFIKFNIPLKPKPEVYSSFIQSIWKTNWHTNNGVLLQALERELINRYDHPYVVVVSSGTVALQMAIELLTDVSTDIITTPYTYVATSSSILWQNRSPVYVDINEHSWNIETSLITDKIGKKTSAILATHLYGKPCDTTAISELASNRGMPVIYDASHCFDVYQGGRSIYLSGDISTASFHATKIFHTVEGGALFLRTEELLSLIHISEPTRPY